MGPRDAVRPCVLAPTVSRLSRLVGLKVALARLADAPLGSLRSRDAVASACRSVAARVPRPPGPARFVASRHGRRAVGHAPMDDDAVVLLAHAVAHRTAVPAEIHGPVLAKVARREGFGGLGHRRLHRDPEVAARREAALRAFLGAWSTRTVRGGTSDGWTAALLSPVLAVRADDVRRLVVTYVAVPGRDVVVLRPEATGLVLAPGEEGEVALRDFVRSALAAPVPFVDPERLCPSDVHLGEWRVGAAARLVDVPAALFCDSLTDEWEAERLFLDSGERGATGRRTGGAPLSGTAWYSVQATARAALARFRTALPDHVRRHAGLVGDAFGSVPAMHQYLRDHAAWTEADYERVIQCYVVAPVSRSFSACPEAVTAIAQGRGLAEVFGVACGLGRPVHRKTLACLTGPGAPGYATRGRAPRTTTRLAALLDQLHAADPHMPRIPWSQLRALSRFASGAEPWVDASNRVAVAMAHRQRDGSFPRDVPLRDLGDLVSWVEGTVVKLVGRGPLDLDRRRRAGSERLVATHVLFPPHQRLPGLVRANADWHARIGRSLADEAAFLAGVAPRDVGWAQDTFVHFLDGPAMHGDVEVRPLLDPDALLAEGREMGHCVGGYAGACRWGASMILALSSPAGRSTAEVRLDEGLLRLRVVQHRGPSNAEAPVSHEAVLSRVLVGADDVVLGALALHVGNARRSGSRVRMPVLSREDSDRHGDILFSQLRRHLWGEMRNMDRVAWLRHVRHVLPTGDGLAS